MQFLPLLAALAATSLPFASAGANCPAAPKCSRQDLATLSCHNTTAIDSCCNEAPGGLLLQTQYWGVGGPKESWTVHGLWPDFCDGTYPEFCDAGREYKSPRKVLEKAGKKKLLKFMDEYWKTDAADGNDESFWKHEFDKHGTCMSTLEPRCYGGKYETADEAVEYFQTTVDLYSKLDSFKWLKSCGIVPSKTKTYKIAEIERCLLKAFGSIPFVGCTADGSINELWYHYYLRGKIASGKYEHTESVRASSCPTKGVKYTPK